MEHSITRPALVEVWHNGARRVLVNANHIEWIEPEFGEDGFAWSVRIKGMHGCRASHDAIFEVFRVNA